MNEIQSELQEIDEQQAVAGNHKEALKASLVDLDAGSKELELATSSAKVRVLRLRKVLQKRIVAIYKMQRRTSSLDYLFKATSATELLKRAYYLRKVAQHDRQYLEQLSGALDKLTIDQGKLEALTVRKAEQLSKVKSLEANLEEQRVKKASLLREERDKSRLQEQSLEKLRTSAITLEAVLASIMGSDELLPKIPRSEQDNIKVASVRKSPLVTVPSEPPFKGSGLASLRGKLSFPVEGRLIQRFGKQKHEEFADMLFIKGLEINAAFGAEVRAVAKGKVIFNKSLPGYGKVVILDHGNRYYTLYGRLTEAQRSMGEVVAEGEVLATLGEPDRRGRNFYFELRIRGKATDPTKYFRQLPESI